MEDTGREKPEIDVDREETHLTADAANDPELREAIEESGNDLIPDEMETTGADELLTIPVDMPDSPISETERELRESIGQ